MVGQYAVFAQSAAIICKLVCSILSSSFPRFAIENDTRENLEIDIRFGPHSIQGQNYVNAFVTY